MRNYVPEVAVLVLLVGVDKVKRELGCDLGSVRRRIII
jgi:hypothetical protein